MKNKVTQEHCIGVRAYGSSKLVFHSFLSSLVTQNFYFLYCKHKTVAAVGKEIELKGHKKKNANANVDRERVANESSKSKMFCNCMGNLMVRRINKASDLSIFLLLWYK